MYCSLKELVKWLGVTVFEMTVTMVSLTVFSVLAVTKCEKDLDVSWWTVFSPLFIADGLNAYFCVIVFIRMYIEGVYKNAAFRAVWSSTLILLLFAFKLLVCLKLQGQNNRTFSEVMTPIFILLVLVMIRTCQLH